MMFPYIASGLVACSYTVNILTYGKISYPVAGLAVTVVAAIYIWAGGIKAVAWTDVIQGFIMLFALIGTGLIVLYHYFPDSTALFDAVIAKGPEKLAFNKGYSWQMYTSMVLMMMWGFISWPHVFIRAYAAKSKKIIRLTSALGPIGAFIAYVPMMIAAFAIFAASTQKYPAPDKALLTELGQFAPIWFFGIVGVAVLASAMSTFDSQAHVAGVILARDLFQRVFKVKDEKKIFQSCRILIAVGLFASYLIALKPPKLMWDILISSYAGVSQLVPPLLAALYWKRATREGAVVGLIAGLLIALLFSYVWVHPLGIHAGLWGMVINAVLLIFISYGSKRSSEEVLKAFYK
jgi:SSS family solute:Na+ symporter